MQQDTIWVGRSLEGTFDHRIATSSSVKPDPNTKKSLVPADSAHFLQENALLLPGNY